MNLGKGNLILSDFNKARSEWRSLKKEVVELETIFNNAWCEFYESFLSEIKNSDKKNPFLEPEKKKESSNNKVFEEECLKDLYRDVAKQTHPDKNGGESIEIFKNISSAKKRGQINEFLEETKKVKKNRLEVSYRMLDKIYEEINYLKNKINQLSNSFCMEWYYAKNSKKKEIMKQIIKYYDEKEK